MRNFRTTTLTALVLIAVWGVIVWPFNDGASTTNANIVIETTGADRNQASAAPSETVRRTTVVQPNKTPTKSTVAATPTKSTVAATPASMKQSNNSTPKKDPTTPSTAKRPKNPKPTATTVVNPPSDDLNQIVANGYVNLKGVRVSAITESDTDGSLLVEECGHLSYMAVTLWFKYANGDITEERWVFGGKGTHIFDKDKYGNRVRRDVYVEAVGVDPYRFTEDWRRLPSDYIWCAILPD
jgi:hypothetical protein